jgi:predicted DNA-binding transcriptional regulator AlpA
MHERCMVVNYGLNVPKVETSDLIDSPEVAALLGLSRYNAVSEYRRRYEDFPEPVVKKGRCLLWRRRDVEQWAKATGRMPK